VSVHVNPADVWARAIIAAARVFGDDPIEAVAAAPTRGRGSKRRSLPAACLGIAKVSAHPVGRVAPVLGLRPSAVRAMKTHGGADFRRAVQAAERAAQYALWRPEAAESVAGSASGDLELVDGVWTSPHIARPHAPVAGPLSLANGYAFAPPFRPGPTPPTQCTDGRILARLAVAPGSPRVLASILDIKESFVALHLRNLAREGLVIAADLAPGQSDRDQAWRVA
jgi:hypothetical protein